MNPLQGKKWNFSLIAFLIPFGAMLFVMLLSGYEPFGDYSMLYSDMYHQYYPFFVDFRNALRSGESLLYTWSVGMGMDYLGLISYYLASPLNLLSVLVPEGWLLEYFSLMMPVKLGLAGLFFSLFLKHLFDKNDLSISVFGGFYGLCAWALGFQWNVMWLDTFALLPLVVLGMVVLLRDGKFLLYTLTLFLAVFANYYIGFFVCIFVFLLFFVYEFCRWQGWKRFFRDLCRIAAFSLLAIGMTAILELPAFAALQTTQSSVNKFPQGFRLNIAVSNTVLGLLDAMRQVAGNMGGSIQPNFKEGLPNLYCGVGSIVLGFLYLQSSQVKRRDKFCALGLLLFFNISFIIRQLDYIWHGFHFTNMIPYRFSFLYSFVLLYMAYRAWLSRRTFDPLQILVAALLTASVLFCANDAGAAKDVAIGSMNFEVPVYLIYNIGFLLLYTVGLLYGSLRPKVPEDADQEQLLDARITLVQRRMTARLILLLVMGVELIATVTAFSLYFPGTSVKNYPKGTQEAASMIRYMHEREREPFFRAETTHSQTLNDGALNGYNGISAFTSSANVKVTEFMKALGYGAKNTYNRYCYEESSPVANLFLNLKYMIERDGKDKSSTWFTDIHHYGNVHLLKNEAYLPLGFLAQKELAELSFDADDSFWFQNDLFTAATGVQEVVWRPIPADRMNIYGNDLTIIDQTATGYCSYGDCIAGSNVVYSYVADRGGFLCLHLNLPKRNDYFVSINDVELYRESISLPQMIAVGEVKVGDVVEVRILCDSGETGTMELDAQILDTEVFRKGYEILNASTLKLTTFENTLVEGTITCDREGLLYTSIPQNGNWTAWVDGKEAPITLVGDCMIGLELSQGEHNVRFTYENPASSWGWKISLLSAAVFAVLIQLQYRPDWKGIAHKLSGKGKFQK